MRYYIPLIILLIGGAFIGMMNWVIHLKTENNLKAQMIKNLENKIAQNNKIIKQLKVDTEKYKQVLPLQKAKVITKYEKIKVKDEGCEAELKAINEALNLYFNR